MRAGPWATMGAAAALPEQEPGGPGEGPRVGVGARGGMEAAWAAQGALHGPGPVPYAGAQRFQDLWGLRAATCTSKWRNCPRWRLEDSADLFSVQESGSSFQCTCLGVDVFTQVCNWPHALKGPVCAEHPAARVAFAILSKPGRTPAAGESAHDLPLQYGIRSGNSS